MRAAIVAALLAGCGGGDAPSSPDAPAIPDGYTRLIGRTWTLGPGDLDTYRCVRFTVPEDTYVTNIIAQAPLGTHHTLLTFADNAATRGEDGEQNCGVATSGMVMLYASGVGTDPLDLPEGVGVKIAAGQQIHLNLHLFNATDGELSGETAILVKAQPAPPPMLAEMVFAGRFQFFIPADPGPFSVTGGCTSSRDFELFALWPHQHQIGTHQKVTIGGTTLLDTPFSFEEQQYYLVSHRVRQGDRIEVTCTWENDTGRAVTFGESSEDEMCFSGMYRYPAEGANLFECTDGASL
jgi:hypothetical protein